MPDKGPKLLPPELTLAVLNPSQSFDVQRLLIFPVCQSNEKPRIWTAVGKASTVVTLETSSSSMSVPITNCL